MSNSHSKQTDLQVRTYGSSGPFVFVLHGGPGTPGYMAPVARELADSFRVIEPFQRGGGKDRLTVARHVSDLHKLIESHCGQTRPAIIGHSWGAMLALAFAAKHPRRSGPLVLIGCGSFDRAARDSLHATCAQRIDYELQQRIDSLPQEFPDPDARLAAFGELILPVYSYDLVTHDQQIEACDARAHEESWSDMLRLQEEGVYPAAFAGIRSPVIMMHGTYDPHPGQMIRAGLEPCISRLEYQQWERCGHYPWLEKAARGEFFTALREWLARQSSIG